MHVLYVGQHVLVIAGRELRCRTNHRWAEIYTHNLLRSTTHEYPGKAAFTTPAIEHTKTANISARPDHWPIEQTDASWIGSLACLPYPSWRESSPFFSQAVLPVFSIRFVPRHSFIVMGVAGLMSQIRFSLHT
jgi:hypothetical protein